MKTRDDNVIKLDIKWDEKFVACGESEKMEEILKTYLWNPITPRTGAWRQDVREYMRTID